MHICTPLAQDILCIDIFMVLSPKNKFKSFEGFTLHIQGACQIRVVKEKSGNLDFLNNVRKKGNLLKFLDNQGEIREKDLIYF